jgi:hypothetical protein
MLINSTPEVPTEISNEGIRGVPVFIKPNTAGPLDLHFVQFIAPLTLAVDTVVNSNTITVTPGHGFTTADAGKHLALFDFIDDPSVFTSTELISVAGDVFLLDSPLPRVFNTVDATAAIFHNNMNVDGSITPEVFSVSSRPGLSGNVMGINMQLRDTVGMDFETFGGLPVLTNGVVVRVNMGNGTYRNLYNFKSNGDIILMAKSHEFTENIGGGIRGFNARVIFGGEDNHGVVVHLDGALSETLEVVIQDDLSGLTLMDWVAQGTETPE